MPPKPKKNDPNKKTEEKKKAKIVEDKTFGLKNKKGAKQQRFIQQVVVTTLHSGKNAKDLAKLEAEKLAKKDTKKKELDELNELFKPVDQKVGKGVDPKSVLCAFFKNGICQKGDKCKFSHDMAIARKATKRNLYDDEKAGNEDNMDTWDEAKLEEVINKKHGESNKLKQKTSIICKHFLDAVENNKYGWFWDCPSGASCIYKHVLPSGFVLKKDKKHMDEQKEAEISLEELIEKERASLSSKSLTKVTLESFMAWKERKRKEKIVKARSDNDKKKRDFTAGRTVGISGREMFEFNPDLIQGDDDEADDSTMYKPEDDEEGEESGPVFEINLNSLSAMAREADNSGTVTTATDRLAAGTVNGLPEAKDESDKLDMAGALPPGTSEATDAAIAAAMAATLDGDGVAADDVIDEDLFGGDDLDLVEEELETLELVD